MTAPPRPDHLMPYCPAPLKAYIEWLEQENKRLERAIWAIHAVAEPEVPG